MTISQICICLAIAVYLIAMLGVGVWFSKRNNSVDDFYLGGRKLATDTFRKQPVPAANCEVFNCTFRAVIVNAQMPILQITAQIKMNKSK